ncbi:MAG TPA: hypothetical protein VMW80_07245 [Candidatus Dormibacteraeota bacterium]|nr:hypothetical protein [Candidatus Dormibacteraeota bacterium]
MPDVILAMAANSRYNRLEETTRDQSGPRVLAAGGSAKADAAGWAAVGAGR